MDEKNHPAIRELLAPEFSAVMGGNPPMSADEWAGMGEMMYAAFPDGKHAIDEALEIGDRVVLRKLVEHRAEVDMGPSMLAPWHGSKGKRADVDARLGRSLGSRRWHVRIRAVDAKLLMYRGVDARGDVALWRISSRVGTPHG